jgi:hypothetical protein
MPRCETADAQLRIQRPHRSRTDLLPQRSLQLRGQGVPIIFFTTGLHPDYHANTDEVSKIEFDKMTRITQMIYETGLRLANLDHAPARDSQVRAGRLTQ